MKILDQLSLRTRLMGSMIILMTILVISLTLLSIKNGNRTMDDVIAKISAKAEEMQDAQKEKLDEIEKKQVSANKTALQTKAQNKATLLAELAQLPLLTFDFDVLTDYCVASCRDKDIISTYVFNSTGEILGIAYRENGEIKRLQGDTGNRAKITNIVKDLKKPENIFEVSKDITQNDEIIGKVVLLVSSARMKQKEAEVETNYTALRANTEKMFASLQDGVNKVSEDASEAMMFLLGGVAIVGLLIAIATTFFIVKSITTLLAKVVEVVKKIARGDLSETVTVDSRDEIGELANAMTTMVESLNEMAEGAGKIAKGDMSFDFKPRSDSDVLGNALLDMTENLREVTVKNEKQDWLKTGQAGLGDIIRGEQDILDLGRGIVSYLAPYLNAQIGAIYLAEEDNFLKLIGSYAYTKRKSISNEFKYGEGLVGQAALEKQSILVSNVPDNYITINSGLGENAPHNIVVAPFLNDGSVKGVIELGSFDKFTNTQLDFLNLVAENIAIAFNSAQSRLRTNDLLEKTQSQAEELQSQQEELRVTNEELEEQAKALKESQSKLQQQQEELQQTNEELEERAEALESQKRDIQKKNIELENAQRVIEEKAEALATTSRYKSEFLANMSHELRTPLNSLLILSRQLSENKDGNLTEKQVEYARTINYSGTDLLTLINDILDLSKVEAGKIELNIEDVNLSELPAAIKQTFMPIIQEKKLSLEINVEEILPVQICTDMHRVKQIIKNLLSNAIKFTHEGGITVNIHRPKGEIHTIKAMDPQKTIAVSVSDTGIGIPKDKQRAIFEAFQQVDGSISRKYGGTGLGLSISRELAKFLGGDITLKSEEGKGSTFTLYLAEKAPEQLKLKPAKDSTKEAPSAPVTQSVETAPAHPPSGLENISDDRREVEPGDKSILIIEDDPTFAKILVDLSHERGYKCLVAGDGKTGLQFADYHKPNAIILDISLPGMDGWAVMKRLKNNRNTRYIPVHFMTGIDRDIRALEMGAIGFLTKPISVEMLDDAFKKIEDIVSRDIKRLLVVEDNEEQKNSIIELINNKNVEVIAVDTTKEAYKLLKSETFDSMILDPMVADKSGLDLLEKIKNDKTILQPPIIVYASEKLSSEEEKKLNEYAANIVIKEAKSPETLLDETVLFLHLVDKQLPKEKQEMIKMVHDKESLMENKKILVVDDDMRNVFAISSILEDKGMNVLVGKNGKDGLECLEKNPDVDLVLMDIMMPVMDGYQAIAEIRKQGKFKDLPIIAVTAKAMKGDKNKCIEVGANDYIPKPVETDRLLSVMRVWLYQNG